MTKEKQCPKCKGEMVQGFVPEYSRAAALILGWHISNETCAGALRAQAGVGKKRLAIAKMRRAQIPILGQL